MGNICVGEYFMRLLFRFEVYTRNRCFVGWHFRNSNLYKTSELNRIGLSKKTTDAVNKFLQYLFEKCSYFEFIRFGKREILVSLKVNHEVVNNHYLTVITPE